MTFVENDTAPRCAIRCRTITASGVLGAVCLLAILLVGSTAAQSPAGSPQQAWLDAANRAFEQALASHDTQEAQVQYQQAIDGFERLEADGVHNAKLYYNLGNAYFLRGDLGRAILHYRRGLRLEPGNRRLQANLYYARGQRIDQFDTNERHPLVSRLLFWHDDLNVSAQATVALVGFLLMWAGACTHVFWRQPFLLWLSASGALLCLLFAASTWVEHRQHVTARHGVVVAAESSVRKGNGESYALQFPQPLHPGAEFAVLETRRAWLYVRLENGATGWIRQAQAILW